MEDRTFYCIRRNKLMYGKILEFLLVSPGAAVVTKMIRSCTRYVLILTISRWLGRMRLRLLCRRSLVRSSGPPKHYFVDITHSLPTADSNRAVVSCWRKDVN